MSLRGSEGTSKLYEEEAQMPIIAALTALLSPLQEYLWPHGGLPISK